MTLVFTSVKELEEAIMKFIDTHNESGKPLCLDKNDGRDFVKSWACANNTYKSSYYLIHYTRLARSSMKRKSSSWLTWRLVMVVWCR